MNLQAGALYALAFVAAPAVGLMALYRPVFLLSALLFVTLIQEAVFASFSDLTALNKAAGAALLLAVIAKALAEGRAHRAVNAVSVSLAALLLCLVSSYLLLSDDAQYPLQNISNFVSGFAYYFICLLAVRTRRDVAMIALAYAAGALVVAYSGAFWEALMSPMEYLAREGHRGIRSTMAVHYIEYAVRCAIPLPVALVLLSARGLLKRWQVVLLAAVAAVLSLAVLLSGSRGAVLSYFFMAALAGLFSGMGAARKAALSLLLLGAPFLLPARQLIDNMLQLLGGQAGAESSAAMRASYYRTIFAVHDPASFIWGHGFENFRAWYFNAAHSVWGQSLYELGIIGVGIQLCLLCALLRFFLRVKGMKETAQTALARRVALGLGISVFMLLFWGLFENVGLIVGTKHLFALMGAFLAAGGTALEGEHEGSPDYA